MPLGSLAGLRAADTQVYRWSVDSGASTVMPWMISLDYVLGSVPYPATPAGEAPTEYARMPALRRAGKLIELQGGYLGRGGTALYDRLWVSGSLPTTAAGTVTVDSVAFPARDRNGEANGVGCILGILVPAVSQGTGTPGGSSNYTVSYTNQSGVSGRTTDLLTFSGSTGPSFRPLVLQSGDTGVRSVQSMTVGNSTQGHVQLALLKLISRIGQTAHMHSGIFANANNQHKHPGLLRSLSPLVPAGTVPMPMHWGNSQVQQGRQYYHAVFALEDAP